MRLLLILITISYNETTLIDFQLYAVPTMILFAILHWCLSQAIFLLRIEVYSHLDANARLDWDSITTCGYSSIAVLISMLVSVIGIVGGLALGFLKTQAGIPLGAGCSAIISAGCHRPEIDIHASVSSVKWGAVKEPVNRVPGHCCITSLEVTIPISGQFYI